MRASVAVLVVMVMVATMGVRVQAADPPADVALEEDGLHLRVKAATGDVKFRRGSSGSTVSLSSLLAKMDGMIACGKQGAMFDQNTGQCRQPEAGSMLEGWNGISFTKLFPGATVHVSGKHFQATPGLYACEFHGVSSTLSVNVSEAVRVDENTLACEVPQFTVDDTTELELQFKVVKVGAAVTAELPFYATNAKLPLFVQVTQARTTCLDVLTDGDPTGLYLLRLDSAQKAVWCDQGWALAAEVKTASCQAHHNSNQVGAADVVPTLSATAKWSDADIQQYRSQSPYAGTTAFWMHATLFANCSTHDVFCSSTCVFSATAQVQNNLNCGLCSTDFEGSLVQLSPNDGTVGLGHHYQDVEWFAYQRYPAEGNNCGFRSDDCGQSDGQLWIR